MKSGKENVRNYRSQSTKLKTWRQERNALVKISGVTVSVSRVNVPFSQGQLTWKLSLRSVHRNFILKICKKRAIVAQRCIDERFGACLISKNDD